MEDLSASLGDFKVVNKLCLDIARNELRYISPKGYWKIGLLLGQGPKLLLLNAPVIGMTD